MHEHDPYRSPDAALERPVEAQTLVLADRGTRLGAVILDGLLGGAIMLPIMLAAFYFSGIFSGKPSPRLLEAMQGGMGLWLQLGFVGVGFALFLALQGYPLARYGQTWGKRWLGIRIVDLEGRKPEFARLIVLRYLVLQLSALVPCIGPMFGLTDILFIFREDQRCVHDLMAGTRVVQGSPD